MDIRKSTPMDLHRWCIYILIVGHATAALIVLAHAIWYLAARSVLITPPDVYLRNYILLPALFLLLLNLAADGAVRAPGIPLRAKEYISLSLFIVYSLYLSLSHKIAVVLLASYILPIFASTIFSDIKLTRGISLASMVAVWLPGIKMYLAGTWSSLALMETFVACFMFLCSHLLAEVLIRYGRDNITALVDSNEEAEFHELAFLQAQIKPHFIYNAMNTIVSFCYTDSERAAKLIVDLCNYLRLLFNVDHKLMIVPLSREIEMTKAYVEIEKARFGELISVKYDIDPELTDVKVPSFCIQPLVENSIKHGLLKKGAGVCLISAKRNGDAALISVCDTGMGMSAERLAHLKNAESADGGVGFFNVSRRIAALRGARLDIQSKEGEGTSVTIKIANGDV